MGLKDWFRRWSSGAAPRVDFSSWDDEALREHWQLRGQLTESARELLAAELARRGLSPPGRGAPPAAPAGLDPAAASRPGAPAARPTDAPDGPGAGPDDGADDGAEDGVEDGGGPETDGAGGDAAAGLRLVTVVSSRAVLLWAGHDEYALVVFPPRDGLEEDALPRPNLPPEHRIAHVLVLDPLARGWMPTATETDRSGVRPADVWRFTAGAPAPAPLRPDEVVGRALRRVLDLGQLLLEPAAPDGTAVRARWRGVDMVALLGPCVGPGDLAAQPRATTLLGSTAPLEGGPDAWERALPAGAVAGLRQAVLLGGARDVDLTEARTLLPRWGADVHVVEPARAPGAPHPAETLQKAALAGDWERVAALEPDLGDPALEELFTLNVIAERPDVIERVLALRCERDAGCGWAWFLRGAHATLREDPAQAAAHYRRAATAERPEARAWSNLAAVQAEQGDDTAALATAIEGLARLPGDEFLQTTLVLVRLRRDGADAARRALAERRGSLPETVARQLAATIDDPPAELLQQPAARRRWPHLAAAAAQAAAAFLRQRDLAQAERLVRRALALDRLADALVPVAVEVGAALTETGAPERALALHDAVLAARPDLALPRYHRGVALVRLGRRAEAAEDFRACADVAEGWDDPRVQLVATLTELGRLDEADTALDVLERSGADPGLVMALDDAIERARGPESEVGEE
jgi:tetratricopeptide (TPR) repeat protein